MSNGLFLVIQNLYIAITALVSRNLLQYFFSKLLICYFFWISQLNIFTNKLFYFIFIVSPLASWGLSAYMSSLPQFNLPQSIWCYLVTFLFYTLNYILMTSWCAATQELHYGREPTAHLATRNAILLKI